MFRRALNIDTACDAAYAYPVMQMCCQTVRCCCDCCCCRENHISGLRLLRT